MALIFPLKRMQACTRAMSAGVCLRVKRTMRAVQTAHTVDVCICMCAWRMRLHRYHVVEY